MTRHAWLRRYEPRVRLWRVGFGGRSNAVIDDVTVRPAQRWRRVAWLVWWRTPVFAAPPYATRARLRRRLGAALARRDLGHRLDTARAAQLAADAMVRLNRHAKAPAPIGSYPWGREDKYEVYDLKTALLRELYEVYPCSVTRAVQRLYCFNCHKGTWTSPSGRYSDVCRKCNGTGVYREHELLLFRFTIGGRLYAWHQLADRWPAVAATTGEPEVYRPDNSSRARDRLTRLEYERLAEVVARYVEAQGLGLGVRLRRPAPTIRECLAHDAREWRRRASARIRGLVRAALDRLFGAEEDDDLPF